MILGFTGTRQGMTRKQMEIVKDLVKRLDPDKVVHGDCKGADADFHTLVLNLRGGLVSGGTRPFIQIRPSNRNSRAYCEGADLIYPPKEPLDRDMDIARECDHLIATPKGFEEEIRSGTWTTVRYVRKFKNKTIYVVQPDGNIV